MSRSQQVVRTDDEDATMPSEVSDGLSVFDKFATYASEFVSRAWFFVVGGFKGSSQHPV
jgi:hypothetical protein